MHIKFSKPYTIFENSVYPDQLAPDEATDQDPHSLHTHKSILFMKLHHWIDLKSKVHIVHIVLANHKLFSVCLREHLGVVGHKKYIIGVAHNMQLRMCVIKIITFKGGHLMWQK